LIFHDLTSVTYCPLDVGIGREDLEQMHEEVVRVPKSFWYENDYRGCDMLPLMNRGGHGKSAAIAKDTQSPFAWTEAGDLCPHIKALTLKKIFSLMEQESRVTVLRAAPGARLNVHIDCRIDEVGRFQHKFRVVLNGRTSDLYFVGPDGEQKIGAPLDNPVYILDGGHPHASENRTNEDRYILCVASPWRGENKKYQQLLRSHVANAMFIPRPKIEANWCDLRRFGAG